MVPAPCPSVSLRLDSGQTFRATPSYAPWNWGGYKLEKVPVNKGGTLTIGPIPFIGKTCSKRVWVSKPAAFESLSLGGFTCTS
jgi:hypothetical protein